jgi:hypothetical protein
MGSIEEVLIGRPVGLGKKEPELAHASQFVLHERFACTKDTVHVRFKHELSDPDERLLLHQHVLLLRTRSFWHSGLIDRLLVSVEPTATGSGFFICGQQSILAQREQGGEVANAAARKTLLASPRHQAMEMPVANPEWRSLGQMRAKSQEHVRLQRGDLAGLRSKESQERARARKEATGPVSQNSFST